MNTVAKDFTKLEEHVDSAAMLMRTLSNKHRLMILCMLQSGEYSVTELNASIPIPQSTLSQHLAWLRKEGFVKTRRDAQTIFYSLKDANVTEVIDLLHSLFCPDE